MTAVFFYGTLCHAPLRQAVFGRALAAVPARLGDHAVRLAAGPAASAPGMAGEGFPMLVSEPGATAEGLLVRDLEPADLERLEYYEAGFRFGEHAVQVEAAGLELEGQARRVPALVFLPEPGAWEAGERWALEPWAERWGAVVTEAAGDYMAARGCADPEALMRRWPQMLVRGGARTRARDTMPTALRRARAEGDVQVAAFRLPYANFFAVEEHDIAWRRFDGTMTPTVTRATFITGDAVVVLPYDPVTDRVMVVEQFRMGPFARGDEEPWSIEAVAGRVDGGEAPEDAAMRETIEEAGLHLHRLLVGPSCYSSPGAVNEYLYHFVGLVDLPETGGVAGLDEETEDIRSHVMPFDALLALIDSGEVDNAPLILVTYWLERQRAGLRAEALGTGARP